MAFGKRKHTDVNGLDVLDDVKEPFSFANFFEDHIVGRIKKIKKVLEEKGILFFFLSPFQQRNRLIAQLLVIVLGIGIGVIPRSAHLIDQAKERNAKSELATLLEKEVQVTCGRLQIRPLMSSQFQEQHLMVFVLGSSNGSPIPSTNDRYEVTLSAARGVSYPEDVTYRYEILPISDDQRLLLVYTDNSKQDDSTGIYHLSVQVKADSLKVEDVTPLEVVLSDTQETTDLFDAKGMDLSVLTDVVLNSPNQPIKEAEKALDEMLMNYTMEVERIRNLPLSVTVQPTEEELQAYVKEHLLYSKLTDQSTTGDIKDMPKVPETDASGTSSRTLTYDVGLVYQDTTYTKDYLDNQKKSPQVTSGETTTETETLTDEEEQILQNVTSLQTAANNVLRAAERLNQARQTKYNALTDLKLMLNQTVSLDRFSKAKSVGTAEN